MACAVETGPDIITLKNQKSAHFLVNFVIDIFKGDLLCFPSIFIMGIFNEIYSTDDKSLHAYRGCFRQVRE